MDETADLLLISFTYNKPTIITCLQADPANVRAATRAATCHLKMGDLDEAAKTLNAVRATLPNSQALPDDLANKQRDLEQTKLLITEVSYSHHALHLLRAQLGKASRAD